MRSYYFLNTLCSQSSRSIVNLQQTSIWLSQSCEFEVQIKKEKWWRVRYSGEGDWTCNDTIHKNICYSFYDRHETSTSAFLRVFLPKDAKFRGFWPFVFSNNDINLTCQMKMISKSFFFQSQVFQSSERSFSDLKKILFSRSWLDSVLVCSQGVSNTWPQDPGLEQKKQLEIKYLL